MVKGRKGINTLMFRFEKGDMFVVHNDLGDGWLWVKSCKNDQKQEPKMKMSGIVNQALVQELVNYSACIFVSEIIRRLFLEIHGTKAHLQCICSCF